MTDLFTIGIKESHKAKKVVLILDNLGILASFKCGCMFYDGKKECQFSPNQPCERGYRVVVPKKYREITISVAHAIGTE